MEDVILIERKTPVFLQMYRALEPGLEEELKAYDAKEDAQRAEPEYTMEKAHLLQELEQLRRLLSDKDFEGANTLLRELGEWRHSEYEMELLKLLHARLENFEYGEAYQALAKYLRRQTKKQETAQESGAQKG